MTLAIQTGTTSDIYRVFLLLHLLAAIVGFGAVMLNGIYGAKAQQRPGPEGRAVSEVNFQVSEVGEHFIYAVPVFGFLMVWTSGHAWSFGQTWLWLSLALYAVALVVSRTVLGPSHRRLNTLLLELESEPAGSGPPPQVAEIAAAGKRLATTGPLLHLTMVVIMVLMIWKPGA